MGLFGFLHSRTPRKESQPRYTEPSLSKITFLLLLLVLYPLSFSLYISYLLVLLLLGELLLCNFVWSPSFGLGIVVLVGSHQSLVLTFISLKVPIRIGFVYSLNTGFRVVFKDAILEERAKGFSFVFIGNAMSKTKMKRVVSMDSYQSRPINEEARVNLKYQILLQEYLELQKEFVSKKKRLQNATVNRETLLAEVRFLRKKHKYLLNVQSPKGEQEFVQRKNSDICFYNEAVPKHQSPVLDVISNDGERSLDKKDRIGEALRVEKRPNNRLIDNNNKRVGKKKIKNSAFQPMEENIS